jgi:hypothetical protein
VKRWNSKRGPNILSRLYVSGDASNDAYVYDYKALKLLGVFKGLLHPYGRALTRAAMFGLPDRGRYIR